MQWTVPPLVDQLSLLVHWMCVFAIKCEVFAGCVFAMNGATLCGSVVSSCWISVVALYFGDVVFEMALFE